MKKLFALLAALAATSCANAQPVIQNLWQLLDTRDVRTANDGESLVYNASTGKWEPGSTSVGSVAWGSVTGTLSNQTDLQNALNAKQPLDADLTGLAANTLVANLSVNGQKIVSTSNGDIELEPNGTGVVLIDGSIYFPGGDSVYMQVNPGSGGGFRIYNDVTGDTNIVFGANGAIELPELSNGSGNQILYIIDDGTLFADTTMPMSLGGLEADVSGYTGLVGLTSGTASEVDTEAELETMLGGIDLVVLTELDTDAEKNTLGFVSVAGTQTISGAKTFSANLTLTGDLAVNGDDITSDGDLTLSATGDDYFFGVSGVTDPQTVRIRAGGGADEPAALILEAADRDPVYIWYDTAGALRYHTAYPSDEDNDGTIIGAGAGSGGWSDAGALVSLATSTDSVAVGGQINSAKLSVDGSSDVVTLALQTHAGQTANAFEIENSGGTVVFSIDVSGNISMNDLDVAGDLTVGGFQFEGSTVDGNETLLDVVDPTGDNTILLPNASGTVALVAGALGAATATTPAANDDDTSVATTEWVQDELDKKIYINAGAFIPTTTAGAAAATTELASNDIMFDSLDFDASTDEFAVAWFMLPETYTSGNVAITFHWTAASGSGDVMWTAGIRAFPDSEAMDQAITLATAASDTMLTANDVHIGPVFSSEAILGTGEGAGVLCAVKISRDADNGSDTLGVDARFLGLTIEW